jgi:hypothetical protein
MTAYMPPEHPTKVNPAFLGKAINGCGTIW